MLRPLIPPDPPPDVFIILTVLFPLVEPPPGALGLPLEPPPLPKLGKLMLTLTLLLTPLALLAKLLEGDSVDSENSEEDEELLVESS